MNSLPDVVCKAFAEREGVVILTTVDAAGVPNSIYAGSVREPGNGTIVIADNYFHKTRANIHAGSLGSLLFITKERKAYQLKGHFSYHTSGPLFADMKSWNKPEYPGVAAAVLHVDEIYSGAERIA
ncbi:pyridoxamine 5'-phosphate oxidase family protein [Opitutus sp. ER46]|uniref:pyridoxamine 5'-phosphate oxidase family protein n=1 Tax=Opitutus sp. ER46 TaxID=2161864 RepID=UPI000D31DBB2|nr:pyridoxamine 5'-phosphate oxidase family protein [Opitutus sp. ER46]PTX95595.1 pyridoxamine 5-phosphate oxidase [Opitutus sp. ER46]